MWTTMDKTMCHWPLLKRHVQVWRDVWHFTKCLFLYHEGLLAKWMTTKLHNHPCQTSIIDHLTLWRQNKILGAIYGILGFKTSLHRMWGYTIITILVIQYNINPSAWGHLNPSSYCDVGRLFYGVFKLWSKLQRKKWRNNF